MESSILYFVAAFGLAYIVGHARISLWARTALHSRGELGAWLVEMVECPACFGFWVGLGAGFFIPAWISWAGMLWPVVLGCATSGMNFLLGRWTRLIGPPE